MKKCIFICLIALAVSCTPDNSVAPAQYKYVGIKALTAAASSVNEDSGKSFDVKVYYGGTLSNDAVLSVPYTVSGATYGTDYTIVGGTSGSGTVSIAAGAAGTVALGTITINPVSNVLKQANKTLTIKLGTAPNGIGVGYPLKDQINLTIVDDDCDYLEASYIKTAQGKEKYSDNSCYPSNCTSTYPVVISKTGTNAFSMDNFWDSGWVVNYTIDPVTLVITIPTQNPIAGVTVSGSGNLSTCTKTLTFSTLIVWPAQNYNDTHTNVYTF